MYAVRLQQFGRFSHFWHCLLYTSDAADDTPLGQLASVNDVAEAVLVVAASLCMTTGAVIPVDGGRPLGTQKKVHT